MKIKAIKSIDRQTIRLFVHAALQNKRDLWLTGLHTLGTVLVGLAAPLFMGRVLAALGQNPQNAWHYLPYFVVAAGVGVVCNRIGFKHFLMFQAKTMSYLQEQALTTLMRRSVGFHNNNVGGKLVSDVTDFPNGFSGVSGAVFMDIVPLIATLIVGTTLISIESWQLGVVVAAMSAYAFISGYRESRQRFVLRLERLKATKAVTAHSADTIVNVQTVKTFARENDELTTHQKLNSNLLDMRLRDWGIAATRGNNRMVVLMVAQLVLLVVLIHTVTTNPALLGISIFAFAYSITLSNRLFQITMALRNFEDGLLAATPITEIILEDVEIVDKPHATTLQVTEGALNLDNLTFEYHDNTNSQRVFNQLNLAVKPGEKIGLVGPSGGGKSTLTRLLLRFDNIDGGSILIDNQNIADVTQASLRASISYVPQEPLMFHRTVRENIAYGKPDATEEQIIRAAKMAHAHDFITKLDGGYGTVVGERGVKLSGGQRQRVAIARAILKDAPILLLDEATSALDSESEVLIQDALWKLMEGRTAIVIAHRLSTIQKMDRIIVLDDGEIVEQGTHKQLLQKKTGLYAKLWRHQSGGFLED
ncbi:MAG TPA: ABC transporter ATP-binding protein [Candidatus Saccharimonadales bacterium]|nr:ABC transporter ATP-binding protein [Candidatus Saccharimonadales bacterium]